MWSCCAVGLLVFTLHWPIPCPLVAGLDIDALRDVSAAVNGLKSQRPDMGILMVTHYKVGRTGAGLCSGLCSGGNATCMVELHPGGGAETVGRAGRAFTGMPCAAASLV